MTVLLGGQPVVPPFDSTPYLHKDITIYDHGRAALGIFFNAAGPWDMGRWAHVRTYVRRPTPDELALASNIASLALAKARCRSY